MKAATFGLVCFALGLLAAAAIATGAIESAVSTDDDLQAQLDYQTARAESWKASHHATYKAWRRRGRVIAKQQRATAALVHSVPYGNHWLDSAFLCIHGFEGRWDDPNPPFWGGVQMDRDFQRSYGREFLRWFGTADNWPISVQIAVAIRAYESGRGFYPWPNTARFCGLL